MTFVSTVEVRGDIDPVLLLPCSEFALNSVFSPILAQRITKTMPVLALDYLGKVGQLQTSSRHVQPMVLRLPMS